MCEANVRINKEQWLLTPFLSMTCKLFTSDTPLQCMYTRYQWKGIADNTILWISVHLCKIHPLLYLYFSPHSTWNNTKKKIDRGISPLWQKWKRIHSVEPLWGEWSAAPHLTGHILRPETCPQPHQRRIWYKRKWKNQHTWVVGVLWALHHTRCVCMFTIIMY